MRQFCRTRTAVEYKYALHTDSCNAMSYYLAMLKKSSENIENVTDLHFNRIFTQILRTSTKFWLVFFTRITTEYLQIQKIYAYKLNQNVHFFFKWNILVLRGIRN